MKKLKTATVEQAIKTVKAGKLIVIVDDEDRENEGDLMVAAEKATPEIINFMTKQGRGLICMPLTKARLKELHLPLMVRDNTAPYQTAFTVSIDARNGVTTGISAQDRAKTIQVAVDPKTRPSDLTRPGHIFPLEAREGGVRAEQGMISRGTKRSRAVDFEPGVRTAGAARRGDAVALRWGKNPMTTNVLNH